MSHLHSDHSLSEVHASVDPSQRKNRWRRAAAFFGPAYLVSVGYMDPGNWATDLQGGSQFGYRLIWVLFMSNLIALLLQSLSARLGIVRGRDLAQCSRELYPQPVNFILYVLAEIAIAACDLAEVLGMAIGLNLLLGLPLLAGVSITLLDTVLLLYLQKLGMRKMEAFIITLVGIIGVCFLTEMIFAKPSLSAIAQGFVPTLPNREALYIAIGIIGATVMPHNLYLHSALVQTRKISRDEASIRRAIKFNTIDSSIALNLAFFVNAAILILAAAVFFSSGHQQVAALKDAHELLQPLLGSRWASHLFAIALIAAGQSSTVTGTLAGQIVMEGYLRLRINPWLRRLLTRLLAIVPAVLVIWLMGESMVDQMLVFSQVLLSMQLAFAVIPLIHFVSDKERMGSFRINTLTLTAAWLIALVIVGLNLKLVYDSAGEWLATTHNGWLHLLIYAGEAGLVILLLLTTLYPFILKKRYSQRNINVHSQVVLETLDALPVKPFRTVALALDFSERDHKVIRYAWQLSQPDTRFILIHIVESASAKIIGELAHDYETIQDQQRLDIYRRMFQEHGFNAENVLGYRNRAREIARIVSELQPDLLVVGSHGHKQFGDWLFGETINSVRHLVQVPIFIAQ